MEAVASEMQLPPGWAVHSVSVLYPELGSESSHSPLSPLSRLASEGRIVVKHTGSSSRGTLAAAAKLPPTRTSSQTSQPTAITERELTDPDTFAAQFALISGQSSASRSDHHTTPTRGAAVGRRIARSITPPELPRHVDPRQTPNVVAGSGTRLVLTPSRAAAVSADGASMVPRPSASVAVWGSSSWESHKGVENLGRGGEMTAERTPSRSGSATGTQPPLAARTRPFTNSTSPRQAGPFHSGPDGGYALDVLVSPAGPGSLLLEVVDRLASPPPQFGALGLREAATALDESPPPRHPGPARGVLHDPCFAQTPPPDHRGGCPTLPGSAGAVDPSARALVRVRHQQRPSPLADRQALSQSPPTRRLPRSPGTPGSHGRHRPGRRPSRMALPPPAPLLLEHLGVAESSRTGSDGPGLAKASPLRPERHSLDEGAAGRGSERAGGHRSSGSSGWPGDGAGGPRRGVQSRPAESTHERAAGGGRALGSAGGSADSRESAAGSGPAGSRGGAAATPESRLLVPWEHDAASNSTSRSGSRQRHTTTDELHWPSYALGVGAPAGSSAPRRGQSVAHARGGSATRDRQRNADNRTERRKLTRGRETASERDLTAAAVAAEAAADGGSLCDTSSSHGSTRLAEPRTDVMQGLQRLRSTTALTSVHQAHPRGLADDDVFARTFTELAGRSRRQRRASVSSVTSTEHTEASSKLASRTSGARNPES